MKVFKIFLIFLGLFGTCKTLDEIPSPQKGSYENPIKFRSQQEVIACLKQWEKQTDLKIHYQESVIGINFQFLDKFGFPYKRFIMKFHNKKESLFGIPDVLYFYVDTHHNINECEKQSLTEILRF
ncbi:MAG: hypothetical protein NZ853_03955 [Leptospiraceae bacterium]|nr:hypothetical protein [Leptospiraceae bacterium]MDW7975329.1 hypothetical protein [Leptospiraceae bacterium]